MTTAKLVRLGRKGQMVLPKEVRTELGVEEGDYLVLSLHERQVLLTTPEDYATLTRGMLKGTWGCTHQEIKQYLEDERSSWEE